MTAAAWLFGAAGTALAGIGVFFVVLRPSLLPEPKVPPRAPQVPNLLSVIVDRAGYPCRVGPSAPAVRALCPAGATLAAGIVGMRDRPWRT